MHNHQPDEHEHSRYRNRVEFREISAASSGSMYFVDIGTEWNLEYSLNNVFCVFPRVDIGTEWNLEDIVPE